MPIPETPKIAIDQKYAISAVNVNTGAIWTETDAIIFLVRDLALPDTLKFYKAKCEHMYCEESHIKGIARLIERVENYQKVHGTKKPD